jgi:antibiotic biosynthesis monooxygenase (ABM) superfamily enzyme
MNSTSPNSENEPEQNEMTELRVNPHEGEVVYRTDPLTGHRTATSAYDTLQLAAISDPITVTVARTPTPGHEEELARGLEAIAAVAKSAPGCLGAGVFAPGSIVGPYQLVVRFENAGYLREWEDSPQRNEILSAIDHAIDEIAVAATPSPDAFFEAHRPIRQIVADTMWFLPISLAIVLLLIPIVHGVPLFPRLLITGLSASIASFIGVRPLRNAWRRHRLKKNPLG